MARILIAAAIALLASSALATVYVVDNVNGADTQGATAFKSLTYALSVCAAGDTIRLVYSGVAYSENVTVSKAVTLTSDLQNPSLKPQFSGSFALSATAITGLSVSYIRFLLGPKVTLGLSGATLDGVSFESCDFVYSGSDSLTAAIAAHPIVVGSGLTFTNCVFENDGTTDDGTVLLLSPANATTAGSEPGPITFTGCAVVGNSPTYSTPNAAGIVAITTGSSVSKLVIERCTTSNGGLFVVNAQDFLIEGNTFDGAGLVLKGGVDGEIANNVFKNTGLYYWGFPSNPQVPAALTLDPGRNLFDTVEIRDNYFENVAYTDLRSYGAIHLTEASFAGNTSAQTDDSFDVKFYANDFSGVAHTEMAVRVPSTMQFVPDFTMNFWGDETGPYSLVCFADGLGPRVSDYIDANDLCLDAHCAEHTLSNNRCPAKDRHLIRDGQTVAAVLGGVGAYLAFAVFSWSSYFFFKKERSDFEDDD